MTQVGDMATWNAAVERCAALCEELAGQNLCTATRGDQGRDCAAAIRQTLIGPIGTASEIERTPQQIGKALADKLGTPSAARLTEIEQVEGGLAFCEGFLRSAAESDDEGWRECHANVKCAEQFLRSLRESAPSSERALPWLAKLIELEEKATPGPYHVASDDADDAPDHQCSGLALIDTGRDSDWPVLRLGEWPTTEFIAALLNAWPQIKTALQAPISSESEKPVAWLHNKHPNAYVITDRVKELWLGCNPDHVENYTTPLYTRSAT